MQPPARKCRYSARERACQDSRCDENGQICDQRGCLCYKDGHKDLPQIMTYGSQDAAHPDLASGYKSLKYKRHKIAQQPARNAVEHGHDAAGKHTAHDYS